MLLAAEFGSPIDAEKRETMCYLSKLFLEVSSILSMCKICLMLKFRCLYEPVHHCCIAGEPAYSMTYAPAHQELSGSLEVFFKIVVIKLSEFMNEMPPGV
jgi:hypothetical protein